MPALFRHLDDLPRQFRGGVVSIGNFDGVHVGHARIVRRLVEMARPMGVPAVILTFDPHPARILRPDRGADAAELARRQGPFALRARRRCRRGLSDRSGLALAFRRRLFSADRAGPVAGPRHGRGPQLLLRPRPRRRHRACSPASAATRAFPWKSWSRPKSTGRSFPAPASGRLVAAGQVAEAARLLGRPYRIRGTVVHGQGRGDGLGYPTANIAGIETLLPGEGIYAGRAVHRRPAIRRRHEPGRQSDVRRIGSQS